MVAPPPAPMFGLRRSTHGRFLPKCVSKGLSEYQLDRGCQARDLFRRRSRRNRKINSVSKSTIASIIHHSQFGTFKNTSIGGVHGFSAWGVGVGVTGGVVGCGLSEPTCGLGVGVLAKKAPGFRKENVGVGVARPATGVEVGVAVGDKFEPRAVGVGDSDPISSVRSRASVGVGLGVGVAVGTGLGCGVGVGVGVNAGTRPGIEIGSGLAVGVGVGVALGPSASAWEWALP